MMLASYFREAVINLLSAKLRSFLAILGVLVGTGSVVALISSSQLATAHALAQFKSLGTNLLSLYLRDANQNGMSEHSNSGAAQFQLSNVLAVEKSSAQITAVAPYTIGFQGMYFGATNLNGQVIGATESFAKIAKIQLLRGRFVSYLDEGNFFCVIGNHLTEKIKTLGVDPLYQQIRVGQTVFTIIGILKPWPENLFISADVNRGIIIPLNTSYLLNKNVHIDNILIRLIKHPDIASAKQAISHTMQGILPNKKIVFNSPEQLVKLVAKQRATYTWLLISIGSISLVVGGIGVMNIMLVSVVERRREIGIRMAVGARRIDILRMFLIESVMLTLFGGFLGIIVGVLTSYILAIFTHWEFFLYGAPIALGFTVSVLVGIVAGFYPAWNASKLDPVLTLYSA